MIKVLVYKTGNKWTGRYKRGKLFTAETKDEIVKAIEEELGCLEEDIEVPDCEEFKNGISAYRKKYKRDAAYRITSIWIKKHWNKSKEEVADALIIFLQIWHQSFFRYRTLSYLNNFFNDLVKFLETNWEQMEGFRKRTLCSLKDTEEEGIKKLFEDLLEIFKKEDGKKSPVGVAKTLHLLAPNFFPLWDNEIARKIYYCHWWSSNKGPAKYWEFCKIIHTVSQLLKKCPDIPNDTPFLKLIDEYNFILAHDSD